MRRTRQANRHSRRSGHAGSQWPDRYVADGQNPNFTNTANARAPDHPFRLDRTQAADRRPDPAYTAEQHAYDNGAADSSP